MTQGGLEKFVAYLRQNDWSVFGPVFSTEKTEELSPFLAAHQPSSINKSGQVLIKEISKAAELDLSGQLPFYSFKRFFVPEQECLFEYQNNKLAPHQHAEKTALLGMSILDLKAVNLYDQVFEKDPYYQRRRRNLLVVGYSLTPEIEDNLFEIKYEEDILEHLPFDIFLAKANPSTRPAAAGLAQGILPERSGAKSKAYRIFTGSIKGQRILEDFGYKDYQHIQYSGPVKEGKLEERMERLRDRLKNHPNPQIWEELGKICIECGKCSLVCPTCFCFRIDDKPALKEGTGKRTREWDSCFYQEFSEVAGPPRIDKQGRVEAGGHKFLNTTAERILFWYFHKFARIPDEFDFMGCVGCKRCVKVCPVGIDITKVLKQIESS